MKKTIILSCLSLISSCLFAAQLTPEEALSRVDAMMPTRSLRYDLKSNLPVLKMSPKDNSSFNSLYIFDSQPGFLVVSADDCAMPLLGYGTDEFDSNEIPAAMQYWLDFYATEIYAASNMGVNALADASESIGQPIEPLVKAKWNQGNPYNLQCPEFNGRLSAAGCVAVAQAQVMSAHQWPKTCRGGNMAYTSRYNSSYIKTLSINFDEVTFDWENLLDSYNGNKGTTANKEAVANLIKACGYSVQTYYSPGESTAYADNTPTALYKYFNYSPYVQQTFRDYYSTREWESLIYNQLSQGLPVMYGGYTPDTGHRFVCDGYDGKGFFHINWGWGGMSDGYFRLSALDPSSQGIGGGASGYYYNQDATINIAKPDVEIEDASPYMIYSTGNFLSSQIALHFAYDATETVNLGESVEFIRGSKAGIQNTSCRAVKGAFGVSLVGADGEVTNLYTDNEVTINPNNKIDKQKVTLPEDLKEGVYSVYPIFRYDNDGNYLRLRCPMTAVSSLKMIVAEGKATIAIEDYGYPVGTGAVFKTAVRIDSFFSMDIELINEGRAPYYGTIGATLKKDGKTIAKTSETTIVDLAPGEEAAFNLIGSFKPSSGRLTAGTYELGLIDSNNTEVPLREPVFVELLAANTVATTVTATEFDCYADPDDPQIMTFTGTLKCNSGEFGGQATVWIFHYDDEDVYYSAATSFFFIGEGETYDFSTATTITTPGDYYAYIFVNNRYIYKPFVVFSIPGETGVKTIDRDDFKVYISSDGNSLNVKGDESIKGIRILNINGMEVSDTRLEPTESAIVNIENLASGIYVVLVETTNNHVRSARFIKR